MKNRNIILGIGLSLMVFGCKPATTTEAGATDSTSTAAAAAPQASAALLPVSLVCKEIRGVDEDAPLSAVAIKIGDVETVFDSISVCEPLVAGEHDIPKDALGACGGWWAGAGDYLYLKAEGNDVVVMAGWQDETQGDEGYHYKEFRRFSRLKP